MALVPHRFLFRVSYPCPQRERMPLPEKGRLLELPPGCRLDNFAEMEGQKNFAEVRLAWNPSGLGIQVEVRGKQQLPVGNPQYPRGSDGMTLWLDMRDARNNHRASRYCHQFHFLATGAGTNHDEPALIQARINRALEDAPFAPASSIAFAVQTRKSGYLLEAFVPALALHGYDPQEHPRLGFFYSIRDEELGEQLLSLTPEFPFWEDPSLWQVLELIKE